MQDINRIQENPEKFKKLVKNKNIDLNIDELLEVNSVRLELLQKLEENRRQRNENTEQIKKLQGKPPQDLIDRGKEFKEKIQEIENEYRKVEEKYKKMMWFTPQVVSEDTPIGPDESGNVEVKKWQPEDCSKKIALTKQEWFRDHIELGEALNLLDLEKGVKTAGFRGYYLKNEGALMHMGLMMYGMKMMREKGFENIVPPTIVKDKSLYGSGHFPFDQENIYTVDTLGHDKDDKSSNEKKYLIGTAEPSILNYSRDEVLKKDDLPIKMAGFSQCYRGEIGSHGKDTRGIYRIHEFMKIEQVVICDGDYEESEKRHQEMLSYSEDLLQALKLPYRVIQLCTGDMGAGKYKMFDIETWMPSRNAYGETHSASNLGDWQTRRLNIKVENEDGNRYYAHALNNTVVASPRILIAIWENYQNEDGSITVPEVLQEYVGTDIIGMRD